MDVRGEILKELDELQKVGIEVQPARKAMATSFGARLIRDVLDKGASVTDVVDTLLLACNKIQKY